MLRGFGASGVAPSSLAAAASTALAAVGLQGYLKSWEQCGESSLSTTAAVQPSSVATTGAAASPPSTSSKQDDLRLQFSIRPSALSPLFPTWNNVRAMSQHRDHLVAALRTQALLASSFTVESSKSVPNAVRKRVERIQKTAKQLGEVLSEPSQAMGLASCPSPAHATVYYAALEAYAAKLDPDAVQFSRVQSGEVSPLAHYAQHFDQPYRGTPRLQPLEVIFSKPHPVELARQLKEARSAEDAGDSSLAHPGDRSGFRGIGPHIDVDGVTHTKGKRKTSAATLDMVPGSGKLSVNGLPVASYFRDLAVRRHAMEPLLVGAAEGKYDISVQVSGGGLSGQAGAVRTALARALCVQQPALAGSLSDMTRWDGRVVERKKHGREKARRGFTWVKR